MTQLHVTIESDEAFDRAVRSSIEDLEADDGVDEPDTISFPDERILADTFNATTLELLRSIVEHSPGSIRETARIVERDGKNVHQDLTKLEIMGVITFDEEGQSKRPVFPYDELVISVPLVDDQTDEDSRATAD